ncbi:hypothetical protein [Streptomyces sp. BE133]|uniref:hypothetical protein n=1 Tax=Streptomyces sp. BE133 TaxID=3002523 RepID=UPI002E789370|nr:hypothetical protein [Streptomyces sp. BE133]MEE1805972.1 hypothetical protein [Streptomyces sp. BE133]
MMIRQFILSSVAAGVLFLGAQSAWADDGKDDSGWQVPTPTAAGDERDSGWQ